MDNDNWPKEDRTGNRIAWQYIVDVLCWLGAMAFTYWIVWPWLKGGL